MIEIKKVLSELREAIGNAEVTEASKADSVPGMDLLDHALDAIVSLPNDASYLAAAINFAKLAFGYTPTGLRYDKKHQAVMRAGIAKLRETFDRDRYATAALDAMENMIPEPEPEEPEAEA